MKIIKTIFINLIFVLLIFLISEITLYQTAVKKNHYEDYFHACSKEDFFPSYMKNTGSYFNGEENKGRKPFGTEYDKNPPVIIFGCSFGYGVFLTNEQSFGGKLSSILKCPVYNRSIPAGDFSQMLFQCRKKELYETVKDCNTVIYVYMYDHIRRSKLDFFETVNHFITPVYVIKNGKLTEKNYDNKILNFIRSTYIIKSVNTVHTNRMIKNERNFDKLTDKALLYFIESKKELETHYKHKINFIVFFYDFGIKEEIPSEILRKKLDRNGFITLSTRDITRENLQNEPWILQDKKHPSEYAWEFFTPEIAKLVK